MRLDLGDTTADAIRFLLLGLGVLLLLRLAYAGLELWMAPSMTLDLPVAIATFRNGYLLGDPTILVVGGSGVGTRLALSALLTALCTVVFGILGAGFGRLMGFSPVRSCVQVARTALFVTGAWWCYAALALPPRSVRIAPTELVRNVRPSVLGELSLPWPGTETHVTIASLDRFEQRSVASTLPACGSIEKVEAVAGADRMELATITPQGADCDRERAKAKEALGRLTQLLERLAR
ncbi:MAG: hypothetical protein JNL43_05015 [Flavobacteriales bacterium]|nr:hypothetical protein [Flavobacteriales bacterium]